MKTAHRHWGLLGLLITLLAVSLPVWGTSYLLAFGLTILMYLGLSLSWNIIAGYTGYVLLGHVSFFGLGAYTSALLITRAEVPWAVAALLGGMLAATVSIPLGYVMLRLRGPYFAVASLGLAHVLMVTAEIWRKLTGGGQGVHLSPNNRLQHAYWAMLAVAGFALAINWWIERSRFGLRLMAIREDEEAAGAVGIDTTRHKVAAFGLSAAVAGLVGGIYPYWLSYLDPPSAFRSMISITTVVMVMFGGSGTVWGPVIGAVSLSILAEQLWANYPNLYLAMFGLLILAVTMFMPRGMMPLLTGRLIPPRRSYLLRKGGVPLD